MVRVILADDHPIVRSGIRNLLEKSGQVEIVAEAATGSEAYNLVKQHLPDVLLLDMELPEIDGPELARRVNSEFSQVKVLALSAYDDSQYILQVLENGAAGYLLKEEAPQAIVDAVLGVARGEQGWMSRKISAQMVNLMRGESKPAILLTTREHDVLSLIIEGMTNQAIAHKLGISDKTVEKYVESLFAKLDVSSRVEAAVKAVRESLV
jgi:DNA-binding NarL/FixJ family response regulator